MSEVRQANQGITASIMVSAAITLAASTHSVTVGGTSLFALCAFTAFLIQWIAFAPSWVFQSEHFFDLTGGLTYITVVLIAVALGGMDWRALLLAALIIPWAVRLAGFLYRRVRQVGSDQRFKRIKRSFPRLLLAWTMQGMWVVLTLAAALAAITTDTPVPLGWPAALGVCVWAVGFSVEVVADHQKSTFRQDPANAGRFIQTGLWRWSRHPNYFGEITLWIGISLIAIPVLQGWQWLTLISPLFVAILLTRISGIPMLERRAHSQWGDDPAYQRYKAQTPALIPWPPGANNGET